MEKRFQQINGDAVVEFTEQKPVKTRFSQKDLERTQAYLNEAIAKFQDQLSVVNAQLRTIYDAQAEAILTTGLGVTENFNETKPI